MARRGASVAASTSRRSGVPMAKIEDSPSWKNPLSIRIDGTRHPSGAWTLKGVDEPTIEVTAPNIVATLEAFMAELVALRPALGGQKRDVLIRIPDGELSDTAADGLG